MKTVSISFFFLFLLAYGCFNPTENDQNHYHYNLAFQFKTLENPSSLIIDPQSRFIYILSGNFYSKDQNLSIQKYDFSGALIKTIIDFNDYSYGSYPYYFPLDITLNDENNICVLARPFKFSGDNEYADYLPGICLMIHNSEGKFLKELDFSSADFSFNNQTVTFKNSTYFITNGLSLFKINKSSGKLIEEKFDNDQYGGNISDLAIDGKNNIWFVGQFAMNNMTAVGTYILKMDSNCKPLQNFNSVHTTENFGAMLSKPSIELDNRDNLYLTTFYCQSFEIYNSSGILLGDFDLKTINKDTLPVDIGLDNNGNLYVLDGRNNVVYIFKKRDA